MNSLCKQYISEVKLLLPAIGKSEKNYLASLTSNLEDFCDDTSPQTIDDLYQEFGTPVDTVNFYISTFSIAELTKRIQTRKYIRHVIYFFAIVISCFSIFLSLLAYHTYQILKEQEAVFVDTVITDDSTN